MIELVSSVVVIEVLILTEKAFNILSKNIDIRFIVKNKRGKQLKKICTDVANVEYDMCGVGHKDRCLVRGRRKRNLTAGREAYN